MRLHREGEGAWREDIFIAHTLDPSPIYPYLQIVLNSHDRYKRMIKRLNRRKKETGGETVRTGQCIEPSWILDKMLHELLLIMKFSDKI
jgi:hypothetical protein